MHPYLLDFGIRTLPLVGAVRLALPTYGVLVATSIIVGWLWLLRNARHDGLNQEHVAVASFWGLIGGIVGGKLGLLAVEAQAYIADPMQVFTFDFLRAAGLVWTAVLGGAAGFVIAGRSLGLPTSRLLDAAAVPLPASQAIGRIGCLMAGCCYGRSCTWPWAIVYHSADAHARTGVPLGQRLHPSPLYEALWNAGLVLPILLWLRGRKNLAPGEISLAYLALYSAGRFLVEFTRGDSVRGLWFGGVLSTSQIVGLLVAPVVVVLWIRLRRRRRGGAGNAS